VAAEELVGCSGVSGRYATALFDVARDEKSGRTAGKGRSRQFRGAMCCRTRDLLRLVRSPVFSADAHPKASAAILDKAGISGIAAIS